VLCDSDLQSNESLFLDIRFGFRLGTFGVFLLIAQSFVAVLGGRGTRLRLGLLGAARLAKLGFFLVVGGRRGRRRLFAEKALQLDFPALETPVDRGVRHSQGTGQPPDADPGLGRKAGDFLHQILGRDLFGPAAMVLAVRDVSSRTAGIGGLQESLPDAFAGLGRDPKGPGGLQQGTLAEFVAGGFTVGAVAAGAVFQEGLEQGCPLFVGKISALKAFATPFDIGKGGGGGGGLCVTAADGLCFGHPCVGLVDQAEPSRSVGN